MIYSNEIGNWKDLQKKVCQIFLDMGFDAAVEKTIKTVRGKVKVDVYAMDTSAAPNIIYLCECKNWAKRVHQGIIHSFRTIMADYGAHCGYIISKHGFQEGGFKFSKNTNIYLLNWHGFQNSYEEKWLSIIVPKLCSCARNISKYFDDIMGELDKVLSNFNQSELNKYNMLHSQYGYLNAFVLPEIVYNFFRKGSPINFTIYNSLTKNYENEVTINSLHNMPKGEFYNLLLNEYTKAEKEFANLFNV